MPIGVSSVQWDLRMAWGSLTAWSFNMFQSGGIVPYTLTGHTFQYLVKTNPTDSVPVIKINSDSGLIPPNAGSLVAQSNASLASVILTLNKAATTGLTAPYQGYHALWMDYADPNLARNLVWGQFFLDPSIQPA